MDEHDNAAPVIPGSDANIEGWYYYYLYTAIGLAVVGSAVAGYQRFKK